MEHLANEIIESMQHATKLYHRLVVVVGPSGTGKTAALQHVNARTGTPLINVNLELSRRMLDLTERQRSMQSPHLLSEIVSSTGAETVLLDNLEILFDVSLQQDPLRLLQSLARQTTVVASWSGYIDGKYLIYGTPGHPEYKRYPLRDFLIVTTIATA